MNLKQLRLSMMINPRNQNLLWSLVFGFALALFCGSQWFGLGFSGWILAGVYLVLFAVGCIAAYFALEKVIQPGLAPYRTWQRRLWWGISLAVGMFLVYQLPVSVFPLPNELVITATGEKNPQSMGSEVWLAAIQEGRKNASLDLGRACKGDWTMIDGLLVSTSNQPSRLVCQVETDGQIYVRFGKHPWSGIVRLNFGASEIPEVEQDLYAENGLAIVNLPLQLSAGQQIIRFLFFLADSLAVAFLLVCASTWLTSREADTQGVSTKPLAGWIFPVFLVVSWSVYLLAYWPGFLSPDTVVQLEEVVSGKFYNWHPAFHTLTLWLITRLWFNPAAIVMVQILALGIILGYALHLLQRLAVPAWLVWLLAIFYALSPAYGLTILTIWKDIAYAIALLALALLTLKIVASQGEWLEKPGAWVLLGLCAALSMLFRHNGAPVAVGTLILIGIAYYRRWKPVLAAAALALLLWLLVTGPLYRIARVDTADLARGRNLGREYTYLGLAIWHDKYATPIQDDERALLDLIKIPDDRGQYQAVSSASRDLQQLALELTLRRPFTSIKFLLDRASFIFQILQPWQSRYEFVGTDIYANPFGFEPASRIPFLQELLNRLAAWTETPAWDWLFWRNAFWMYLLIFSTIVGSLRLRQEYWRRQEYWQRHEYWRRSWQVLILPGPVLLNALPLALLSAGQLARYILPTLLISPLLIAWLLAAPAGAMNTGGATVENNIQQDELPAVKTSRSRPGKVEYNQNITRNHADTP